MSVLKNFVKYHSLGNDFVVFDWYKRPAVYMHNELHDASWKKFVVRICDRHYGVGADGVLIITSNATAGMPEMLIFNADGTQAEMCLNGVRCVAHYLYVTHHFPDHFTLKVGDRVIECSILSQSEQDGAHGIVTRVGCVSCAGEHSIDTANGAFNGFVASIGNPHFIIFQETTIDWLAQHGKTLETHPFFERGTNVEFVWMSQNKSSGEKTFNVLVYERGCGITLACSSGAAAITGVLLDRGMITKTQKIILSMPGGSIRSFVDVDGSVVLQATAQQVFKGSFEDQVEEYHQLNARSVARL
jgi:diaminopimelate epimerase